MAVNWPPAPDTYPTWPPPEFSGGFWASDWLTAIREFQSKGFTHDAPTPQERNLFFRDAACGDGHNVIGRMVVSPDGLRRYPFAVCNSVQDRELLVLWSPFTCGWLSGPISF
jgi:hypothetical protein